jgi:predicted acylesterase/phospholipase RssA
LSIGGGSERGAYEAGVIIGLINNLPAGEAQWDVVTGIGLGALNAGIVGQVAKGQEASAVNTLTNFWSNFTFSQVYTDWPGGLITGLLLESGLYDSSPLKKTISKLTPSKFQRWTAVGATDLVSGNYVLFNSSGQTLAAMQTGILASVVEPGILPFVNYNKLQLVSGSLKFGVDLDSAVNGCKALGFNVSQVVVHVVMGAARALKGVDAEVAAYELFEKAIEYAQNDFPGIQIPYVIYPSQHLNSTIVPYEFTPAELAQQLSLGQQDAKSAVTKQEVVFQ